jgi:hypothetical protein
MISGLRAINPNDRELTGLKFLLMNRTGCASFAGLRTIDGIDHDTFDWAAYEFKIAHKVHEYFQVCRESRAEAVLSNIILEMDKIDYFVENFNQSAYDVERFNELETYLNEQLLISFELGHF